MHDGTELQYLLTDHLGSAVAVTDSDGTNTYIYGNDRIAQVNTGTEYFLGDALGSVRQLTNNSGAITYASAYDPYGVTPANLWRFTDGVWLYRGVRFK